MKSKPQAQSLSCWSDYWAGGVLTSLPEDFASNYDGEIAQFWFQQFGLLADGASILDVCTGNGAIALLAAQAALDSGKRFNITALDGASIFPERAATKHPHWNALIKQIEFVDKTPFEGFAGADQSFDLIISQYGMEYCDWPLAAAQCARLLKTDGRLVIISHSVTTDIVQTMRQEHAEYQVLMNTGLIETVNRALSSKQFDQALGTELGKIKIKLQQAQQKNRSTPSQLLDYGLALAAQAEALNPQQWQQYADQIQTATNQLSQGYQRLSQMFSVHQRMFDQNNWSDIFVQAGLTRKDQGSIVYKSKHRVGDFHVFAKTSGH